MKADLIRWVLEATNIYGAQVKYYAKTRADVISDFDADYYRAGWMIDVYREAHYYEKTDDNGDTIEPCWVDTTNIQELKKTFR